MQTVLFHDTVFGPIKSRRLGSSLGINLMPNDGKICSFDCLYCEAGFNSQGPGKSGLPSPEKVKNDLEKKLVELQETSQPLDVITFSGNGEPTLHPDFAQIIDDTVRLRDKYFPDVKISVLTNSTQLHRPEVTDTLRKVDNNILKLDSAIDDTLRKLDRPANPSFNSDKAIDGISAFGNKAIVQTMFTRGSFNGIEVDNTTPDEINALVEAYKKIKPGLIMIYSIDRKTPARDLHKVSAEELGHIADIITRNTGIPVSIA